MLPQINETPAQVFHFLIRRTLSAGHQRKTVHALCLIQPGMTKAFFFRHQTIYLYTRIVMCGLGAPFAILRTPSRLRVDNGTHIKLPQRTSHRNPMCRLAQFIQRSFFHRPQYLFRLKRSPLVISFLYSFYHLN